MLKATTDLISKVLKLPLVFPYERRPGLPVLSATKDDFKRIEQIRLLCSTNDNKDWHIEVGFSRFNFNVKSSGAKAIIDVYQNLASFHFRLFNCDRDMKCLRVETRRLDGGQILQWQGSLVFGWPESLRCRPPPLPPTALAFMNTSNVMRSLSSLTCSLVPLREKLEGGGENKGPGDYLAHLI